MNLRVSLSGERPDGNLDELWTTFEAVGLIRGEFLQRRMGDYLTVSSMMDQVATYIAEIAEYFSPRPVWYRTTDLWTNEANPLRGIDKVWEEESPIIGRRGLRRGLLLPDAFETEAHAITSVAARHKNLHVLLPFVGSADEFSRGAEILARAGWPNRIGCMLEIPSAILEVERFAAAGATNLMLGLNDLTCLLTGSERGSDYYDKLHRSVWWCVDHVCERLDGKVEWGIAGSLSKPVLEIARSHNVPYVSLHYCELPELLGVDKGKLIDIDVVLDTRIKTRERAAEYAKRHQGERPLSGGAVPA
jgi:phosphoenolpyruvate-protein kinase (PTS system EI component)